MRPDTIQLVAPRHLLADTLRFYRALLAREPDAHGGRGFTLVHQDLVIVPGGTARTRRETGLSFRVHGLDRLLAHLLDQGFLDEGFLDEGLLETGTPHGGILLEDPAGNVLRLIDDE